MPGGWARGESLQLLPALDRSMAAQYASAIARYAVMRTRWVAASVAGMRQLEQRGGLEVVAVPGGDGGLALAQVLGPVAVEHHRQVVAGHDDGARAHAPHLPDHVDGGAADGGIVGHVRVARDELGAVLGGIAREDDVAVLAAQQEGEAARRVARRDVGGDAGQHGGVVLGGDDGGPALQLLDVELWHRRGAPGLLQRPGQLLGADDDAGVLEERPVDRMVPVRVCEQHVGDLAGLQAAGGEAP